MSRKIQVLFRQDQAECAVTALEYISARFRGHCASSDQPAVKLATKLALERAQDVASLINEAIAKTQEA